MSTKKPRSSRSRIAKVEEDIAIRALSIVVRPSLVSAYGRTALQVLVGLAAVLTALSRVFR